VIIEDLSQKNDKLDKLFTITKTPNDLTENERQTLFVIGQHFIFGIEGTGLSKIELQTELNKTGYIINKDLKL
jgi:hypothetical protein